VRNVLRNKGLVLNTLFLCVLAVVSGCSTEQVNPPTELQDFERDVWMKRMWKSPVGAGDDGLGLELSPVVIGDNIVTIDADGVLSYVNLETGKLVMKRDLAERVLGGLALDQLCLYYSTAQGDLVCVDRESGNPRWRRKLSSEIVSPAGTDGRVVVVHATDGSVFAHDASEGNLLWQYDNAAPALTLRGNPTPVVKEGQVVTGFANGELIAFDARTGVVQWEINVGVPKGRTELERLVDVDGAPVVIDNRVYAVGYQGNLVAIDRRTGGEVWAKPMSSFNGMTASENRAFVSLDDGTIVGVNSTNGNKAWQSSLLKYRRTGSLTSAETLLFVDDFEGYVHVFTEDKGKLVARIRPDRDGVMGDPLVWGDHLYFYARDGYLVAYHIYR